MGLNKSTSGFWGNSMHTTVLNVSTSDWMRGCCSVGLMVVFVNSYLCPWDWAEGVRRPHHRLRIHHGGLGHHRHGAHLRRLEKKLNRSLGQHTWKQNRPLLLVRNIAVFIINDLSVQVVFFIHKQLTSSLLQTSSLAQGWDYTDCPNQACLFFLIQDFTQIWQFTRKYQHFSFM